MLPRVAGRAGGERKALGGCELMVDGWLTLVDELVPDDG